MSNNKFAQKAFALTLGAVLALGTVPAFAYASETQEHPTGENTAGENQFVAHQTEDPGWFDEHGNPIDKNGNPIKEGKGSNYVCSTVGGHTQGVKDDWETRELRDNARKLWCEMYPNADVPEGLFGPCSSGVTFPKDEPATNIANESELEAKKADFMTLVKMVYPDTVFPEWLIIKNEGGTSLTHGYDVDHPERQNDVIDETSQGPTTHGYNTNDPAGDYAKQNPVIDETEQGPTTHGYNPDDPAGDYEKQNGVMKDEGGPTYTHHYDANHPAM